VNDFLQFLFAGVTVGAIYALVALGFSLIYSASHVVNFAQGEFVMLGGMGTVFLHMGGLPLWLAAIGAIFIAVCCGLALEFLAIRTARNASLVTLIIITIGASIALRGGAQLAWDRNFHSLPAFSGDTPIQILSASLLPQTLWILGVTALAIAGLQLFLRRTSFGRAIRATASNRLAALLVGIDISMIMAASFALSAGLGALAGVLITPLALTHFNVGILLGLKGFAAAILGGLGSATGAIVGGLLLGLAESLGAGYVSSAYKDAIAFIIILAVLLFRPEGILGRGRTERV